MLLARVDLFEIVGRRRRAAVAIASPQDFVLRHIGTQSEPSGPNQTAYCVDFDKRNLWFAICDDPDKLLHSPFLYAAQYRSARRIVTMPFKQLDEAFFRVESVPTFIFSIGRCGSTLLTALLEIAGAHAVSEPDVITQLATLGAEARRALGQQVFAAIARACSRSLSAHAGKNIVLKLRSQCNSISAPIARTFPSARFIYVLRGRRDWAKSRYRAFGGTPESLAHMYKWGIESFDRLQAEGKETLLLWYEDIVRNPDLTLQSLREFRVGARVPSAHEIQAIMTRDSQWNTALASKRLCERRLSSADFDTFENEWRRIRPDELIFRHSLDRCL